MTIETVNILQMLLESIAGNAQRGCGARYVPAAFDEHARDMAADRFGEVVGFSRNSAKFGAVGCAGLHKSAMLRNQGREIPRLEHVCAFQDVLEFADVAGIIVRRKRRLRGIIQVPSRTVEPPVVGYRGYVLRTLAKRRNAQRNHIEAHEQVFAEASVTHKLRQVFVGRGDQAHVCRNFRRTAYAHEAAFLQSAQQDALRFKRQLGDFIEEKRAAVRQFEKT